MFESPELCPLAYESRHGAVGVLFARLQREDYRRAAFRSEDSRCPFLGVPMPGPIGRGSSAYATFDCGGIDSLMDTINGILSEVLSQAPALGIRGTLQFVLANDDAFWARLGDTEIRIQPGRVKNPDLTVRLRSPDPSVLFGGSTTAECSFSDAVQLSGEESLALDLPRLFARWRGRGQIEDLFSNPSLALGEIDIVQSLVQFVPLTVEQYSRSTFLGATLGKVASNRRLELTIDELLERSAALGSVARKTHYVFHVGHCGSTLISRLLGALPGCFALREPPALNALSHAERALGRQAALIGPARWNRLLETVVALLGRVHEPGTVPLVKPTSYANNLMRELMQKSDGQALFIWLPLEPYLATVLRRHRRRETNRVVRPRLMDFVRRTGQSLQFEELSDAKRAVLIWLTTVLEMTELLDDRTMTGKITTIDFEDFLRAPAKHLSEAAAHLRLPESSMDVQRALDSAAHRYAKGDQTRPYDASVRERELRFSRSCFPAELAEGLGWAEMLATRRPEVAAAVSRFSLR